MSEGTARSLGSVELKVVKKQKPPESKKEGPPDGNSVPANPRKK